MLDNHLDPVPATRIDDEDDAIKVKQNVQPGIMLWLRHYRHKLSQDDNACKGFHITCQACCSIKYMMMNVSLWGHKPQDQTLGDKLGQLRNGLTSLFRQEYAPF